MEEQLISIKTAILAKEKGFKPDSPSTDYVKGFTETYIITDDEIIEYEESEIQEEDYGREGYYLRPSQSLLQKWLREKHNIIIIPLPKEQYPDKKLTNEYNILVYENNKQIDYFDGTYWGYEEALETGLQNCLKLIK